MLCHVTCQTVLSTPLTTTLLLIGMATTLGGAAYAFILSKKTDHEKAWLLMAFGLAFYALHQLLIIPWVFGTLPPLIHVYTDQISLLLASVFILISMKDLYAQLAYVQRVTHHRPTKKKYSTKRKDSHA